MSGAFELLYLTLLIGAALSVLIGLLLIVDSARVLRWNSVLNRWFSTQEAFRTLDESRDVKRVLYRGHRICGLLVVAGALYALSALQWRYPEGLLGAVMLESLRLFLVAGNLAALAAGVVVFFRPSLLKPLERWADRVYRPRITEGADKMRLQADALAEAHPKLLGLLTAAGGAYVLLNLYFLYNS